MLVILLVRAIDLVPVHRVGIVRVLLRMILAALFGAASFALLPHEIYLLVLRRGKQLLLRIVELMELVFQLGKLLLLLDTDLGVEVLLLVDVLGVELALQLVDFFFELADVVIVLLVDLLTGQLLLPRVELGPHVHRRNLTLGDAARSTVRDYWLFARRALLLQNLPRLLALTLAFGYLSHVEVVHLGRLRLLRLVHVLLVRRVRVLEALLLR